MIKKIAVIGTGVIGTGWIIRCLAHSFKVIAYDKDPKSKKKGFECDLPISGVDMFPTIVNMLNASKYLNIQNIGKVEKGCLSNFLVLDNDLNIIDVYLEGKKING